MIGKTASTYLLRKDSKEKKEGEDYILEQK